MGVLFGLFLFLACLYQTQGCGSKNVDCVNSTTYRYCFVTGSTILYTDSQACEDGHVCDEEEGTYACIEDNTSTTTSTTANTTSTTTTTASPTTTTTLSTTITTASPTNTTTLSTTTSTVQAVTAPATCTSTGVYEAENCNQYYECVYVMWWYELVLQTCSSGQAFNTTAGACTDDSTCTS